MQNSYNNVYLKWFLANQLKKIKIEELIIKVLETTPSSKNMSKI